MDEAEVTIFEAVSGAFGIMKGIVDLLFGEWE